MKSKEELEQEMSRVDEMVEEQFAEIVPSEDQDISDSQKQWRKEVSQYPLLKKEEEIYHGMNLKKKDGIFYHKSVLDLKKLLPALNKSPNYEELLSSIYNAYTTSNNSSHQKEITILRKYLNLRKKLNRLLTDEELERFFAVDTSFFCNEKELQETIHNFITYLTSRDIMIRSNLRLVGSIASKYSYKTGMDFLDLVGEGSVGLIKATETYNAELGYRFSTYATWWIRQSITRYLSKNLGDTKVPVNYYKEAKDFKEMVEKLEQENHKKYTVDDLIALTGLDRDTIVDYLNYQIHSVSLDTPVGEEEDSNLGDMIVGSELNEDEIIFPIDMEDGLKKLFYNLTPEEKKVVCYYFGIGLPYPYGIVDTAKELNLTKNRVDTILSKAMNKMRHSARYVPDVKRLELYLK